MRLQTTPAEASPGDPRHSRAVKHSCATIIRILHTSLRSYARIFTANPTRYLGSEPKMAGKANDEPDPVGDTIVAASAFETIEKTFALIKPDAVQEGYADEICNLAEIAGFKLVAKKKFHVWSSN